VRVLACVLAAIVVLTPSAAAVPAGLKLLARDGNALSLVYVDRATPSTQPLTAGPYRQIAFSGDGRLTSIGGTIVGRVKLPTPTLTWAPTGERAAYTTTQGAVVLWTPDGKRKIEPNGWATRYFGPLTLAWSSDGTSLAISRGASLWSWRAGAVREVVRSAPAFPGTGGPAIALPAGWTGHRILWWDWPGSGSVASDGVALYANGTRLGTTLMYRDYVASCGSHLAFAAGRDRTSTHGKSIVFDGRDASHDPTRSWVSPTCTAAGRLIASAGLDLGICCQRAKEFRSLWQLLPTRRRLTHPPAGWSDEEPHVFANGDVLFVRARLTTAKSDNTYLDTLRGNVMLLSHGKVRRVAEIGYHDLDESKLFMGPYYDHYDFSQLLAVRP
jgi:hypothetical protein